MGVASLVMDFSKWLAERQAELPHRQPHRLAALDRGDIS